MPVELARDLAGCYTLERELGRGGMATVYLARDLKHDRPVALKVLHPELAATLGPERFLREIRTTARLQHPHILPVLDSGEAAGQLWYTMPYVRGESLRDRLRREVQLPVEVAVYLAHQIALALDYREGVIHRDLKPENILLSDGQALVADFGVAKALAAGSEGQLTETGMAVGTPAYMSPEQASAGQVDGRSDIYALGCVLYEMLAGDPPFTGRTPQAIIAKRMLDQVPHVRTMRESVPEPLEQALARALAKVPADRFATADEFARALALSAVSPPAGGVPAAVPAPNAAATAPAPSVPIRGRRVPAVVTALGLGLLLGLGVFAAWLRARPEPEVADPKRVAVLPFENLGRPEDEYFADGVADAVRGKLAALPNIQVTARSSSSLYKRTAKSPQQIGRELGVHYLLTGTVRWAKEPAGQSRVQVSPELVQVSTGSTRWQEPFEAPLTDVFQVQADMAARVALALGVALGTGERERLAERPTRNLVAYDAYLRGEEAAEGLATLDPVALKRAREFYERAVALDSTFALAWAQLSRANSILYSYDLSSATPAVAEQARRAAERALALAHQREAQVLDPRSVWTATLMVDALVRLRRYAEALGAAERAIALAPANLQAIHAKVQLHLSEGDLAKARTVLRAVPREVDPAALVAYMALRGDLYWILDDTQQRLLLRLSPEPFGNNRADWGLALAETYALRADTVKARAYADSAPGRARLRGGPRAAGPRARLPGPAD